LREHARGGKGIVARDRVDRLDFRLAEVTKNDEPVPLSAKEFHLLRYLIERAGSSIPREELLSSIWGYDAGTLTRTVDVHVASLRKKLEINPSQPELIVTVPGLGYKFLQTIKLTC